MTLFGIRWLEIHFITNLSEQNGQHEKLNITNKDWDHIINPYHSSREENPTNEPSILYILEA